MFRRTFDVFAIFVDAPIDADFETLDGLPVSVCPAAFGSENDFLEFQFRQFQILFAQFFAAGHSRADKLQRQTQSRSESRNCSCFRRIRCSGRLHSGCASSWNCSARRTPCRSRPTSPGNKRHWVSGSRRKIRPTAIDGTWVWTGSWNSPARNRQSRC